MTHRAKTTPASTAGSFAPQHHSEPELTLGGTIVWPVGSEKTPGLAELDRHRQVWADELAAFNSAIDPFVFSVTDHGHLTRGTPGRAGVGAVELWGSIAMRLAHNPDASIANRERGEQFVRGLRIGLTALFHADGPIIPQTHWRGGAGDELTDSGRALERARTKRAGVEHRKAWALAHRYTDTLAEQRGALVAGAALSHTDEWWGFRNDPLRVIVDDTLALVD